MSRARLVLAIAAGALGLVALAAAHDVGVWNEAAGDGHVGATWLPGDPAGRVLAVRDDVALRRGERAFAAAIGLPARSESDLTLARRRVEAGSALSTAIDLGSPRQASRAGNLLGILAATTSEVGGPVGSWRLAIATFDAAIRADGENVDAKYNLELLLRRIVVVDIPEGPGYGSGDVGQSLAGAGAGGFGAGY